MKGILNCAIVVLLSSIGIKAQAPDSLTVYYYENFPFSFTENGKLKGLEVDIIDEYCLWLKEKKNIQVTVTSKQYTEFGALYTSVKNATPKTMGLGSITNTTEREKEVLFSPPYLQNVAVLITEGKVSTIKTKTTADVNKGLGNLKAVSVDKSSHSQYVNELKKRFLPELKTETAETQNKVLDKIANDKTYFGYVDIVAYWSYLKNNPDRFLKIQKLFNEPKEYLGFIMPKNSLHSTYINEFFESGFGFTSTKIYHHILEKYLGYEIIESVEIK